jgi:hypothetical protein
MDFWQELSPAVKRYLILAAVLVVGLLVVRSCFGPETEVTPPPRGVSR